MRALTLYLLFFHAFFTASSTRADVLQLPATGVFNGYLGHLNVVECTSVGQSDAQLTLDVRDNAGALLGALPLTLAPNETKHLILNALPITDLIGTYVIRQLNGSDAKIVCHTALYRLTARGQVQYAFSLPVQEPLQGITSGIVNSFNPEGSGGPVFNWLSIYNPGDEPLSAAIALYSQDGELRPDRGYSVTDLAPGARQDLALGHEEGQVVGLYEIRPEGSSAYGAFLTRYSPRADGSFNFAFPLLPRAGSCADALLPASTMDPASNWAEVANPTDQTVEVEIQVLNQLGAPLLSEARAIAPRAQTHLFLNTVLGVRGIGSVRVLCRNQADSVLLQSAFYGHPSDGPPEVRWAYASQSGVPPLAQGEAVVSFLNTYLGAANWQKYLDLSGAPSTVTFTQYNASGEAVVSTGASAAAGGAIDLPFHETAGVDFVGSAIGETETIGARGYAELLRVFPGVGGSIGYIMNLPAVTVPNPDDDGPVPTPNLPNLSFTSLAEGLSAPVYLTHAGDGSGRLFVVEQPGRVRIIGADGVLLGTPYLDLTDRVGSGGERGLLSVAFHPAFAANGRFFVNYTNTAGDTVVSEFVAAPAALAADPATERVLFTVDQPFANHNGGQLQFGPDGMLYIGMGDGGSGGDPLGHGQNLGTLLGALLRIDVDGTLPYGVPADNPFINTPGVLPEIWAYGFRNPWRFSFDRLTGALFLADVGQRTLEEVNIVTAGGNYGWNTMEGDRCFNPMSGCDRTGLSLPIAVYGRDEGVSISGGYLYRGLSIRDLYGKYLFADFGSTRVFLLTRQGNGQWVRNHLLTAGFPVSSFGEDEAGELFVLDYNGRVLKVVGS